MNDTQQDTRTVVVEREFPHPPEKVWRALTQQHLIEEWLMTNDFKAEVGRAFTLQADWGAVDGQVLKVEPEKALVYRWKTKDLESVVSFTLTPTQTGTHLSMQQTGFRSDQEPYYRGARAGWPRFLANLEQVLLRLE